MSGRFDLRTILVEVDNGIATLTLNRPEAGNRADDRMHSELSTVFSEVRADRTIRAVILTGAGEMFCGGGDSSPTRRFVTFTGLTPVQEAQLIIDSIVALDQPLVAAVNGDALGLGAILATFADASYASPRSQIGDRHVVGGVTAGNGAGALWPLLIGLNRTKQLLLEGQLISAENAARIGLITAVTADPLSAARAQAERWCALDAFALQSTKRSLNIHLRDAVARVMPLALALEEQSLKTFSPSSDPPSTSTPGSSHQR